jgi:hypothetical protein
VFKTEEISLGILKIVDDIIKDNVCFFDLSVEFSKTLTSLFPDKLFQQLKGKSD